MLSRRLAVIPSIYLEAALKLIAMWLGACRLGMCSNSALLCSGRMIGPGVWGVWLDWLRMLLSANVGRWSLL